jgi:hypothetical protein
MHSNPLKRREFCTGWATLGYQSRPGAPEQIEALPVSFLK